MFCFIYNNVDSQGMYLNIIRDAGSVVKPLNKLVKNVRSLTDFRVPFTV